jgi:hypothetical protein
LIHSHHLDQNKSKRSSGYGENCITYSAVDHALAQALQYLRIETPEEEWMPEQLATVGEVFLETARILARRYNKLIIHTTTNLNR